MDIKSVQRQELGVGWPGGDHSLRDVCGQKWWMVLLVSTSVLRSVSGWIPARAIDRGLLYLVRNNWEVRRSLNLDGAPGSVRLEIRLQAPGPSSRSSSRFPGWAPAPGSSSSLQAPGSSSRLQAPGCPGGFQGWATAPGLQTPTS